MIITISGEPGSGKTTVAKALATQLNMRLVVIGSLFRREAKKEGISILTLTHNKRAFKKIQHQVELWLQKAHKKNNIIIDGRDAFYHLPESIKVFLKVNDLTAAKRIFLAKRASEKSTTLKEALKKVTARKQEDQQRYKTMHGIDYLDEKNYDIVIDTTRKSVKSVLELLIKEMRKKKEVRRVTY